MDEENEIRFLPRVGGTMGLSLPILENIMLYGEIGYEWIEKTNISVNQFRCEIDYSGMTLSTGAILKF